MATDAPRAALGLAIALLSAGCVATSSTGRGIGNLATTGFVYTRTTRPLMTNFDQTPVAADSGSNNVKTITLQNFDVAWGEEGIGAIAREKGIAEIYYADLQVTRYLGFFRRDRVRIYGRAKDSAPPPGEAAPFDDDTGQ